VPLDQANLPSTEVNPAEQRSLEIMGIQRDIARRRRRRLLLLFTRLSFFVFAPAILAGYYFYAIATPMYASKAEFLILQADSAGGSGIGGLLQGTQFATNQDAIAVQSYLQSKDAMLRLDDDMNFKEHFTQDWIDPIQRMTQDPSNEDAYKVYKKYVKIAYDPTEGVIKMEVSAADPLIAAQFAEHLIDYAEERVDELSRRKREDGMVSARESLERAINERREAQEALVRLQEDNFIDPEGYIASLRTQISNYEVQLQEKELQLQALLDNLRPNEARVDGVRGDVRRLRSLLDDLNSRMTDATTGETSLAEKASRIQMAQADLATADLFLQSALQNEKQTELEANRQVRYLTTSVNPVAAQDPSYPRKFENTILAFLILAGAYLMISLTASILREQVST
jgi:capsular polysaccharide transport system permease protein